MRPRRPPRDPQRGNSLLLALIVMSALATLGSLTVVSMQSSIQTTTNDRAQAIAMYAAESGAAVAMDFLRQKFDATGVAPYAGATSWSRYITPNNDPNSLVVMSAFIPSSDAAPGTPNNPFDGDQQAWFNIQLLNNRDDQSFGAGGADTNDTDGIVIIRSTGHGPQGSVAIIEWEVQRVGYWASVASPPAHVAPDFVLPDPAPSVTHNPPSIPWAWGPPPTPPVNTTGMVLRGWHIVSL